MNKAEKHAKEHGIFAMTGTQKPGHQSLQDTLETASISEKSLVVPIELSACRPLLT